MPREDDNPTEEGCPPPESVDEETIFDKVMLFEFFTLQNTTSNKMVTKCDTAGCDETSPRSAFPELLLHSQILRKEIPSTMVYEDDKACHDPTKSNYSNLHS